MAGDRYQFHFDHVDLDFLVTHHFVQSDETVAVLVTVERVHLEDADQLGNGPVKDSQVNPGGVVALFERQFQVRVSLLQHVRVDVQFVALHLSYNLSLLSYNG